VGPRAGLDAVANRKARRCRESNPSRPARSLDTILTELSLITYVVIPVVTGILAAVQFRILRITAPFLQFYLSFRMGAKLGFSHRGKSIC
jgi:hypothetical protein